MSKPRITVDPLYTIFEQHLYNFSDHFSGHFSGPQADRAQLIEAIVQDYLKQIRKLGLSVPKKLEAHVFEELCLQVNTMLVKKIYGCQTLNEFTQRIKETKKRARPAKKSA